MEKRLIAILHILYLSKQYAPGDILPASDKEMTNLWIKNGAARWSEVEQKELKYQEEPEEQEELEVAPVQQRPRGRKRNDEL